MPTMLRTLLVSFALFSACGAGTTLDESKCHRGTLERDFTLPGFTGAKVDAQGHVANGQYLVSTTYLQLSTDPAKAEVFQGVMGPISAKLPTVPGLAAVAIGTSVECNSARTLALWDDEASMLEFVTGTEHAAAMSQTSQFSRGGSTTTHFTSDQTVTWADAVTQLAVSTTSF
jgi:hypothetical protein